MCKVVQKPSDQKWKQNHLRFETRRRHRKKKGEKKFLGWRVAFPNTPWYQRFNMKCFLPDCSVLPGDRRRQVGRALCSYHGASREFFRIIGSREKAYDRILFPLCNIRQLIHHSKGGIRPLTREEKLFFIPVIVTATDDDIFLLLILPAGIPIHQTYFQLGVPPGARRQEEEETEEEEEEEE